jgi:hypothetical protein
MCKALGLSPAQPKWKNERKEGKREEGMKEGRKEGSFECFQSCYSKENKYI